jgi:Fur family transcriptional regulator, ferric uptake regulator
MTMSRKEQEAVWGRLRRAGLRVTPLRRRLVHLFASSGHWYSAQELSEAAETAGLRPGRATVYRLIEALIQAGLCRPFSRSGRMTRYVFCAPEHHHHMICLECGRVADVATCKVTAPDSSFAVEEHSVDFFGRCAACQKIDRGAVPARR